jgi:CubicO group peptidase (beta-lactamase class C family)
MDPAKLDQLREWLLKSDDRKFAAVVIRRGHVVLQVERGNDAATDAQRLASVSKAICATVLSIASEWSQQGRTPRKMTFDDRAFDFIPWAQPLSDPRKAQITVRQLFNHTSGLCPEAVGAKNEGTWQYVLGHTGDPKTASLAFDPGTACGYSTHALDHAALVCETVTGKPYDQFAIEALLKPIGCEHWWFEFFEGDAKHGRHPSHGIGLPARDLARIGYCMMREGRWNDQQVIPRWFVEQTANPTQSVTTPELRFKLNPQVFSHGWQLPALLGDEGERNGKGIPRDARYKPGSGGQLVAFVPSLDLVVVRQTGSSGTWAYEEFLRRACAAVIAPGAEVPAPHTRISIRDGRWFTNDQITNPGSAAEGLLMNVRMVNATFEDRSKPEFDAEANTDRFIAHLDDYAAHGVNAFTLCLQGGMPGYEGAVNSAFEADGGVRSHYMKRVERVIRACDQRGLAVILGLFYQRQSAILKDDDAIRAGVVNAVTWVRERGFENVLIEVANEYPHRGFAHELIRKPGGMASLIRLAKETAPGLLFSASGYGDGVIQKEVAEAADFLLPHWNGTQVEKIPARIATLKKFGKPILCNEDDKTGAKAVAAMQASIANGAGYGLMLSDHNQTFPFHFDGAADDTIYYAALKAATSQKQSKAPPVESAAGPSRSGAAFRGRSR